MITNKDIGFILIKIDNSALYDNIFNTIQSFIQNNPYNQYVVFNSFCEKIDNSNIPILHLNQAKFFHGSLVLFDFVSIIISKKFPNIHKKYFYAQNIPWESIPKTQYAELSNFLIDDNLDIITKNQYVYDIYDICWKKPLGISENFDYESLQKIL
jgi:hypothetical protein